MESHFILGVTVEFSNNTSAYLDKYLSAELSYIELPVLKKKSSLVFFFFTLPGWLSTLEDGLRERADKSAVAAINRALRFTRKDRGPPGFRVFASIILG